MMILMQKIEVAVKHEANIGYKHNIPALLWNTFEIIFFI